MRTSPANPCRPSLFREVSFLSGRQLPRSCLAATSCSRPIIVLLVLVRTGRAPSREFSLRCAVVCGPASSYTREHFDAQRSLTGVCTVQLQAVPPTNAIPRHAIICQNDTNVRPTEQWQPTACNAGQCRSKKASVRMHRTRMYRPVRTGCRCVVVAHAHFRPSPPARAVERAT